jgi:DNA-binding transcriptional LysR family regulator
MQIETLKIFCDLAEALSFSKTAEKHFLSQSAISQQLAQLELTYRCQLINRRKRPIELTAEGQAFYSSARDIIERYELLKSELNALKSPAGARINVAAIYSIGMHTLPVYVKKFMSSYPKVNVHVEYFSVERIYEMVLSGETDVGLVAVPKKDKRLDVYDFENEPLVLVCSPAHRFASFADIDIHKLQFERFIAFDKDVPTRMWIDGILSRYNVAIQPVMEFDNIETVKRAVELNSGISILPQTALEQEIKSGTLRSMQFTNEDFFRPTGIIVRKRKVFTQAGRYFLELLRKKDV